MSKVHRKEKKEFVGIQDGKMTSEKKSVGSRGQKNKMMKEAKRHFGEIFLRRKGQTITTSSERI